MRIISLLTLAFILCSIIINAEDHQYKPKEIIPGEHKWTFSLKEVQDILIAHLKSKKVEVPAGTVDMEAEPSKYTRSPGYIILTIREKQERIDTCK